ncbi:MAG: ribonuclease P protein component [Armatimonadota bacterium]
MGGIPSVGRLTRSEEFRRVYQSGTHRTEVLVVVHACPNSLGTVRLGVPVGRRFGTAVARNRLKRRLREAVRSHRPRMSPGVDLVVVPRTAAGTASYAELRNGVGAALKAARVLTGDNRKEPR